MSEALQSPLRAFGKLPSGRHGLPREVIVRSQRERMVESMISVVALKGYTVATVADIISTAGVSRATFYEQFDDIVSRARVSRLTFYEIFPDKEACFLAAYDAILGRFVTEVIKACQEPGLTWPEQIERGIAASLSFLAAEQAFARMCIVDMFSAGPSALERYLSAVRLIAAFVDGGRIAMPDREDVPRFISSMVIGGAAVVIRAEIVNQRTEYLPEVGPDLVYSILVPYMDREEALQRSERYAERMAEELDS